MADSLDHAIDLRRGFVLHRTVHFSDTQCFECPLLPFRLFNATFYLGDSYYFHCNCVLWINH